MHRFCNGFLQWVFTKFGYSYTLLDVYNIFEELELPHAHYDASIMKPPSRSKFQPPPTAPTKSSHFSLRVKVVHSTTPVLPSCNYYGNPTHKANGCNILFEISFVIIMGKRDIKKLFVLPSSWNRSNFNYHGKNLPAPFVALYPKAKAP
jgi:hypothetical protein